MRLFLPNTAHPSAKVEPVCSNLSRHLARVLKASAIHSATYVASRVPKAAADGEQAALPKRWFDHPTRPSCARGKRAPSFRFDLLAGSVNFSIAPESTMSNPIGLLLVDGG